MRPPDKTIGTNYLSRWHLWRGKALPDKRKGFRIHLHRYVGSGDDRAVHDHPAHSVSFLLRGRLIEVTPYESEDMREVFPDTELLQAKRIPWLWPVFRKATHTHRIVLEKGPAWTVFIMLTDCREWGFKKWSQSGYNWVPWWTMTTEDGRKIESGYQAGRGCE